MINDTGQGQDDSAVKRAPFPTQLRSEVLLQQRFAIIPPELQLNHTIIFVRRQQVIPGLRQKQTSCSSFLFLSRPSLLMRLH